MPSKAVVQIVANNPNDQIGGGGCLCSETKRNDCVGPYAVFPATEMESAISPHAVLCLTCMQDALEAARGEVLNPTTDPYYSGGSIVTGRQPGRGPRDADYVPANGEDAKLPRDGSPGAYEVVAVLVPAEDLSVEAVMASAGFKTPADTTGEETPASAAASEEAKTEPDGGLDFAL